MNAARRLLSAITLCCVIGAAAAQSPPVPLGPSAAAPTLARPALKTLVILGDSFAGNTGLAQANLPCGTACTTGTSGNYFTWAQIYSAYALSRPALAPYSGTVTNCGVGGTTTSQILANLNCVFAAAPDVVIYAGGTNDAATSVSCAAVTANNRAIYSALNSAGIIVIKTSVIPRTAFTTAQANLAQCYNMEDRRYAETSGANRFFFVDLDPIAVDPAAAGWTIRSGFLRDGIHPSNIGGSAMGYAIAQVVNKIVPTWRTPLFNNGDVYDATNNPQGNLLPNGAFAGTGGSATGGCTGTVAANVQVDASAAGGASCVASTTTLADGRPAQVVTIGGASASAQGYIVIRQTVATPANITAGDTLEGQAWVNFGTNSNIDGVDLQLYSTESSVQYLNDSSIYFSGDPFPGAGLANAQMSPLATSRRLVSAAPSQVLQDLRVYFMPTSSPTMTITVASESLRKVLP